MATRSRGVRSRYTHRGELPPRVLARPGPVPILTILPRSTSGIRRGQSQSPCASLHLLSVTLHERPPQVARPRPADDVLEDAEVSAAAVDTRGGPKQSPRELNRGGGAEIGGGRSGRT